MDVSSIPRRLDKYLRDCTALSVTDVRSALTAGRVTVNQRSTLVPEPLVFTEDRVCLDGVELRIRTVQHCAILNKPRSVTTTARDPAGKQDLSRWLAEMPAGMFPVGRLDRDTTGLLLFTTDGDLSNAILQPEHQTTKQYWLWLNEQLHIDDPRLRQLTTGVMIGAQRFAAKQVEVLNGTADYTEVLLTLSEGKKRQIRRMCYALDLRLLHLHRLRIGPLNLGGMTTGAWRLLEHEEHERLWLATGGRAAVATRKVGALLDLAQRLRREASPHARLELWLRENGHTA